MKIDEVETAKIPMGIAIAGEMGGRFWGSGKGLSRFRDMPKNFASQPTLRDGAKVATVSAFRVRANDKDFLGLRVDLLDMFDHCTVNRMFENHDIARL